MRRAAGRRGTGPAYVWNRDRWRVRATEWVLYALGRGFRWITWPVGTWTLAGALAPVGGWLALGVPAFRRRAEANLAHVWPERPEAERRAIVRDAGRHFLRTMVEYAHVDWLARNVEIDCDGIGHLAAACAAGRGAVVVTAHYGNWEAVRIAASRAGIACGLIYRAFNNRYLDRFAMQVIAAAGEPVLRKGPAGLREGVRHVRRGGVLMILVDQRNTGAPFLPFLGRRAETMLTAAEVARRAGAALIPAVARREIAERRFRVVFEPEIGCSDPLAAMEAVNARIGAWIETEPGQWFWFHRRWKSTARSRPA